ncbi:hypothetical protein ATY76_21420 [Rhizobium sp. R339]|nr:hypothetical protein ATY76_21420 [Rhizobium sp. R339]
MSIQAFNPASRSLRYNTWASCKSSLAYDMKHIGSFIDFFQIQLQTKFVWLFDCYQKHSATYIAINECVQVTFLRTQSRFP